MLNNVRITACTLVPLSLALCISWWHCCTHCFTQPCVTLVVTLDHQRALCKWQAALCTTHVAWYYGVHHWRVLAAHALLWSFSFKPSVCFSKVFFKAMGPWSKGPEPSVHEGGRFALQWSTTHLRNHPVMCWWDRLHPRWVLPTLMPSPARARGIAERDGESRKLEMLRAWQEGIPVVILTLMSSESSYGVYRGFPPRMNQIT